MMKVFTFVYQEFQAVFRREERSFAKHAHFQDKSKLQTFTGTSV